MTLSINDKKYDTHDNKNMTLVIIKNMTLSITIKNMTFVIIKNMTLSITIKNVRLSITTFSIATIT